MVTLSHKDQSRSSLLACSYVLMTWEPSTDLSPHCLMASQYVVQRSATCWYVQRGVRKEQQVSLVDSTLCICISEFWVPSTGSWFMPVYIGITGTNALREGSSLACLADRGRWHWGSIWEDFVKALRTWDEKKPLHHVGAMPSTSLSYPFIKAQLQEKSVFLRKWWRTPS